MAKKPCKKIHTWTPWKVEIVSTNPITVHQSRECTTKNCGYQMANDWVKTKYVERKAR